MPQYVRPLRLLLSLPLGLSDQTAAARTQPDRPCHVRHCEDTSRKTPEDLHRLCARPSAGNGWCSQSCPFLAAADAIRAVRGPH